MVIVVILLVIADLATSVRVHILENQIKRLNERIDKLEEDKSNS